MNFTVVASILIGIVAFAAINIVFDIKFFRGTLTLALNTVNILAEHLGRYNEKRYIERVKREQLVKQKENIYAKYNRFVEQLILDFNIPLTLESFTSVLCVLFVIVVLVALFLLKSITLSVVITIAIFIALLTIFVMQAKETRMERLENIMDAEDIICPLAKEGVLVAIKKVMENDEYISPNISEYFKQFIDNCENNGYSFRQAMNILNKQLGSKFDEFAEKAIIFEYNERVGMADIFLDIVDENAVLREINLKKERIFRKMNRDFLMKTAIIILFFIYALSVEDFRNFMMFNDWGKTINTLIITAICVSFAKCQALQGNLGIRGGKK